MGMQSGKCNLWKLPYSFQEYEMLLLYFGSWDKDKFKYSSGKTENTTLNLIVTHTALLWYGFDLKSFRKMFKNWSISTAPILI